MICVCESALLPSSSILVDNTLSCNCIEKLAAESHSLLM